MRSEIREWMSGERAAVGLGAESLAEPFELSADRAFRLCDECRTQIASVYVPVNVDTLLPLSYSIALRSLLGALARAVAGHFVEITNSAIDHYNRGVFPSQFYHHVML